MRRTVPAVVVALLLVLAGCSLPANLPGSGSSPTPTPAGEGPPGVEEGRLADGQALLEAHNRTVLSTGFESDFHVNGTTTFQGEVVELEQRQQTVVEPGAAEYRFSFTKNVPATRSDVWGNSTMQASRAQSNAGTAYNSGPPTRPRQLSATQTLGTVILGRNFSVTSVDSSNGTDLYTLRQEGGGPGFHLPENATNVSNYNATLLVDRKGRIRTFEASANYTVDGQPGSMSIRYRLVRVGGIDVERPDWVPRALNEST